MPKRILNRGLTSKLSQAKISDSLKKAPLSTGLRSAFFAASTALLFSAVPAMAQPANMLTMPLKGNSLRLKLSVPSTTNCSVGDWDAIQQELRFSPDRRLLVSLEGFAGSDLKPLSKDIGSFDLSKGFVAAFDLPKITKPTPVAIYVCKDTDKTGKCSGKPPISINKIWEAYSQPYPKDPNQKYLMPTPTPAKPSDKIYLFGFLVLTPDAVYAVKPELRKKGSNEALIEADLGKLGVADFKKVFAEFKKVDGITISAHPLPVAAENLLEVFLPRLDPKQCEPTGKPSVSPSPAVSYIPVPPKKPRAKAGMRVPTGKPPVPKTAPSPAPTK